MDWFPRLTYSLNPSHSIFSHNQLVFPKQRQLFFTESQMLIGARFYTGRTGAARYYAALSHAHLSDSERRLKKRLRQPPEKASLTPYLQ